MNNKSVAIDGPAGAGKSTLARMLAEKLLFLYVDTGAIYRTVGLLAWRNGVVAQEPELVLSLLSDAQINLCHGVDGVQRMYLNGADVSKEIRHPDISFYASAVSALPGVRSFLIEMQRDLANRCDVIMDGRDIGTVVLPKADVKIFLTADVEDRARRRHDELLNMGNISSYDEVLRELQARDARDSGRAAAPLRQAEGATLVDTTGKTLEESFRMLFAVVKERLV